MAECTRYAQRATLSSKFIIIVIIIIIVSIEPRPVPCSAITEGFGE